MNRARYILVTALVLIGTASAGADLSFRPVAALPAEAASNGAGDQSGSVPAAQPAVQTVFDAPSSSSPEKASPDSPIQHSPAPYFVPRDGCDATNLLSMDQRVGTNLWSAEPWSNSLPASAASHPADSTEQQQVIELPGLPSSSSLFLSAMLSVGAWHMVRKASHLHIGHLPDWYHADAPDQIGHSVAFDIQYTPLILSLFDEPARPRYILYRLGQDDIHPHLEGRFSLQRIPRAPPVF